MEVSELVDVDVDHLVGGMRNCNKVASREW